MAPSPSQAWMPGSPMWASGASDSAHEAMPAQSMLVRAEVPCSLGTVSHESSCAACGQQLILLGQAMSFLGMRSGGKEGKLLAGRGWTQAGDERA